MSRSTADITKHLARLKAAETNAEEQSSSDAADKSKTQVGTTASSSNTVNVESKFSSSLALTSGESKIEDQSEACSYTTLNDHFDKSKNRITIDQYVVMLIPRNPTFFMLTYIGERKNECEEGKIATIVGLKFHISLPEPENEKFELSKGWGIVNSVLRTHQTDFKMIRRGVNMFDVPEQRGKIITIYTSPEKDSKAWQAIFQEITEKLAVAKIPPGYRPPGTSKKPERVLDGCNYITYRYLDEDGRIKRLKGQENEKIKALLDEDMQIKEQHDPIGKIKVAVANQIDIPAWEDNAEKSIFRKTH